MADPPVPSRFPTTAVITTIAAVLAFLALLAFPLSAPNQALDASWSTAYAYFFKHKLQAGTDYIFTYGPLGFLLTAYFDPDTFLIKWVYEVALKAYILIEIIRIARLPRSDGKSAPWWHLLAPLAVTSLTFAFSIIPETTYTSDAFAYIVFFVLATASVRDTRLSPVRLLVTIVIVVFLSLAKATLLSITIPIIFLCALRAAQQQRPVWQSPLLLFPLFWIALWLLLGQHLNNIVPYFLGALSVANGYSEAMSLQTNHFRDSITCLMAAFIALVAIVILLSMPIRTMGTSKREKLLTAIYRFVLILILLLAWKHGFTRGGDDHPKIFFLLASFAAPFLWSALEGGIQSLAGILLTVLATLCAVFGVVRGNDGWFKQDPQLNPALITLPILLNPVNAQAQFQKRLDETRIAESLPRIRSVVGDAWVDMWSFQQGILFSNDLHYRPHPSLQGYNSYTQYLQEKDIAFFDSSSAPEYLVFKSETIDWRYPTLDGGPAFAALLLRYEPLLTEKGYILMHRRTPLTLLSQLAAIREAATVQTVASEEPISVPPTPPGTVQMVAIELTPTPLGTARRLLYKPVEVYIGVKVVGAQNTIVRRLIPTMAAQGFVLSPKLDEPDSFLAFYAGKPIPTITRFAVGIPPESLSCFQHQIKVRLYTVPIQANDGPTKLFSSGRQQGNTSD